MRASVWASALLAAAVLVLPLAGCGTPAATTSGNCSSSPHQVQVVVELGSGKVVQHCAGFSDATIAGEAALRRSGIEFQTQHFSFGDGVCQVDHQPESYSNCFGSGQPYWALFTWSGPGPWKSASTGISEIKLRPGEALGWRYDPSTGKAKTPPKPKKLAR